MLDEFNKESYLQSTPKKGRSLGLAYTKLSKQKALVFFTTVLFLMGGLIYLKLAQPVFEAEIILAPPRLSQLNEVNIGRSNSIRSPLKSVKASEVYKIFSNHLKSQAVKNQFFQEVYLPSISDVKSQNAYFEVAHPSRLNSIKQPIELIEIKDSIDDIDGGFNAIEKYVVIARTHTADLAEQWVQQYILLAEKQAIKDVKDRIDSENKEVANYNQRLITAVQGVHQEKRAVALLQLKDSLNFAKNAKLKLNPETIDASVKETDTNSETATDADINRDGAKNISANPHDKSSIEAKIKALNAQEDDTIYLQNLLELEAEYKLYSSIDLSTTKIQVYSVDGGISVSETAIWPNKKLVLFLALVSGLLAGSVVAFFRKA